MTPEMITSALTSDLSLVVEFCAALATIIYIGKLTFGGEMDYNVNFGRVVGGNSARVDNPLLDLSARTSVGVGQLISEPKRSLRHQRR